MAMPEIDHDDAAAHASRIAEAKKQISFGAINEKNIEQVKKLNLAVFPVRYNDEFYKNLAGTPIPVFNQLGACRPRPASSSSTAPPPRGTRPLHASAERTAPAGPTRPTGARSVLQRHPRRQHLLQKRHGRRAQVQAVRRGRAPHGGRRGRVREAAAEVRAASSAAGNVMYPSAGIAR